MQAIRLRYEKGQFVPLDPLPTLEEGQEGLLHLDTPAGENALEQILQGLNRSAGAWSGPEGEMMEAAIQESRQKWDEEWQHRLNS
jgi:predicted DNA-binding antitoxin AbrB/MazE fold protein